MFTHRLPRPNYLLGVETSGRQARTGVCMSGLSPLFVLPTYHPRTAYIHGLEFCTGDFVIIMDADFSHHVRVLALLWTRPSSFFVGNLAQVYPSVCEVRLSRSQQDIPNSTSSGCNKHTTLTLSQVHGTDMPPVQGWVGLPLVGSTVGT